MPLSVVSKELSFIVSITCYYSWLLICVILCIVCLLKHGSNKKNFLSICWTRRCATHHAVVFMLGMCWTADSVVHLIQCAWHIIHTANGGDLAPVNPRIWITLGDIVVTEHKVLCPTLSSVSVWQIGKQKILAQMTFLWPRHRLSVSSSFWHRSKNTSPRIQSVVIHYFFENLCLIFKTSIHSFKPHFNHND